MTAEEEKTIRAQCERFVDALRSRPREEAVNCMFKFAEGFCAVLSEPIYPGRPDLDEVFLGILQMELEKLGGRL